MGSGKTALVAALCRLLAPRYQTAVITNDIYTKEDAEALLRLGVLPPDRVVAVETGCCPHTAIRDDVAANLEAVDELCERFPTLELLLIESGGDNLTATFSPALADLQLFVIDVAGGDKVQLPGFLSFDRTERKARTGHNPGTGAEIQIPAATVPRVKAGKSFKDAVST